MKRRFLTAAVSAAAVMLCTVPAYAASNKISTIRLEVEDNMQVESALDEEEELEIDTSADDYAVSGWEIMNERITWELTDIPEVQVTLVTEDDNYFSVSKSNVKIKGDDAAEVVSVKKESSQELIVTLRLLPMSQRVGKVPYAEWEGKNAVWAPAAGALSYDIYLFRDSRAVGAKRTTSETTYDFGVALNKEGEYYYRVRPVGGEGVKEGVFTESDSIYRSEDILEAEKAAAAAAKAGTEAADAGGTETAAEGTGTDTAAAAASSAGETGTWVPDGAGWRFFRADGSQQYNDWLFINGKWYFFAADGSMKTGWVQWKELWYFLGPDGDMWANCQTPDGYFVNQDGVWVP